MKRFKKDALLIVYWDDIVSDSAWQDEKMVEKLEPAHCKTVGFFTMKRKHTLILAHTISKGERDSMVIPVGCITKVEEIK